MRSALAALAVAAALPLVSGAGTLRLLSVACVVAAAVMSCHLLLRRTGMMPVGQGAFVALGMYAPAVVLTATSYGLPWALGWAVALGLVVPLAIGAACLRLGDTTFSLVVLAVAVVVALVPLGAVALPYEKLPDVLVGEVHARFRYWPALAVLAAAVAATAWKPRGRLAAFVAASFLATLAGTAYALAVGGASPGVAGLPFTLSLAVVALLAGAGRQAGESGG
ncbi:hypothetical protein ACIBG8_51135 [Nonomuraea sp. NPDC050556]|uniref:hypothetical protein n=1 Tax=Nonomuraea sp. NPDC050556 TaxID=3364369 RepID=UPI00379B9D03